MVSIIVPVYNVEKYLDRCVDSIINQSYKDLEIILVDDGSKDSSGSICDEYLLLDKRIKVVHKENGGLSDARNVGIDRALGDFVCFVDSDDFIHPEMVERLVKAQEDNCADMVVCNFCWIEESETEFYKNNNVLTNNYEVFYGEDVRKQLYLNNIITAISCCKLFKKEIFATLRYPVGKLHEDEFVIHYILDKCNVSVYLEDKLYFYLKHENSISNRKTSKNIFDAIEAYDDRWKFYKSKNDFYMTGKSLAILFELIFGACRVNSVLCESDKKNIISLMRKKMFFAVKYRALSIKRTIRMCGWCFTGGRMWN